MKDLNVKLINTTYSIKDARELVVSLLDVKIKFLKKKIKEVEAQATGGGIEWEASHLKIRLQKLQAERLKMDTTFTDFEDFDNVAVAVEGDIQMKIKKAVPVGVN